MNNNVRNYLLFFLTGVVVTLIPTMLYISSMPKPLPFHYAPNATAERKPYYLQILETQGQVDTAKETGIYLSDQLTIGSGLRVTSKGLSVYLKREIDNYVSNIHYGFKSIPPLESEKKIVNGYAFIPNAIVTPVPSDIQILKNQTEVDAAKADKDMTYKDDLEIGGAVVCRPPVPCYGIPKSDVESIMVVKPFKSATIQK